MTTAHPPLVAFLPGNGHVDARLDPARAAIDGLSDAQRFRMASCAVPTDLERFEDALSAVEEATRGADLIYATGIGGLVALALRARGAAPQPTILQAPVLWGLESRRFPKLMRLPLMPRALVLALRQGWVQRRFMRKHFRAPLRPDMRAAFFGGYRDASAFARWFEWLTPELLRSLERELAARPDWTADLEAWWGTHDHVVTPEELRITEAALGATIPLRTFDDWGHYPMIDDPGPWVREVAAALPR